MENRWLKQLYDVDVIIRNNVINARKKEHEQQTPNFSSFLLHHIYLLSNIEKYKINVNIVPKKRKRKKKRKKKNNEIVSNLIRKNRSKCPFCQ